MDDLLNSLPPEVLEQLIGLGTLDEQQALLEQQMQQAQALRGSGMAQGHRTGVGAGLAGLGDVLNGVRGGLDAQRLQGEMGGLLEQKKKGRSVYADLLRRQSPMPDMGTAGAADAFPLTPFRLG